MCGNDDVAGSVRWNEWVDGVKPESCYQHDRAHQHTRKGTDMTKELLLILLTHTDMITVDKEKAQAFIPGVILQTHIVLIILLSAFKWCTVRAQRISQFILTSSTWLNCLYCISVVRLYWGERHLSKKCPKKGKQVWPPQGLPWREVNQHHYSSDRSRHHTTMHTARKLKSTRFYLTLGVCIEKNLAIQ